MVVRRCPIISFSVAATVVALPFLGHVVFITSLTVHRLCELAVLARSRGMHAVRCLFSFANYLTTVVEFCLRNQAMTFKRFPLEVQLNMVEYLVSVRDVGWTRNGIRIGTTSSGMDELIESSRKVWTHESEWCIYMQGRRASRIAGRFFYQLLRDVYVGRIRREADHTSLSIVELEIGLQELYIDIAARARALGVDPTEASIPEDAAARLGLRAHALL